MKTRKIKLSHDGEGSRPSCLKCWQPATMRLKQIDDDDPSGESYFEFTCCDECGKGE